MCDEVSNKCESVRAIMVKSPTAVMPYLYNSGTYEQNEAVGENNGGRRRKRSSSTYMWREERARSRRKNKRRRGRSSRHNMRNEESGRRLQCQCGPSREGEPSLCCSCLLCSCGSRVVISLLLIFLTLLLIVFGSMVAVLETSKITVPPRASPILVGF